MTKRQELVGKRGIVLGAANHMSIAWAIAQACAENGAAIGLTFQNPAIGKRISELAKATDARFVVKCNVSDKSDLLQLLKTTESVFGGIDFVVHSIAFADRVALAGRYIDVPQQAFQDALRISCFSLTAITQILLPIMNNDASILTMTAYGSEKVLPGYGLMGVAKAALEASVRYLASDLGSQGIRVNAISAGPVRTLSSAAVPGFTSIMGWNAKESLLRRNVSLQQVADAAVYLLSDRSLGITADILHVDSGHHAQGMSFIRKAAVLE
jgi:enoyl-[acyl-carrier protein] reductase I